MLTRLLFQASRSASSATSRPILLRNLKQSATVREIVQMAHAAGVSCEGEIGFVGYAGGEASAGTDPEEAARFAAETGVDAMAISVGNVHLQEAGAGGLDVALLRAIEARTDTALVIEAMGVEGFIDSR